MGALVLGEVDQYPSDQIIAQRGETMGKVHGVVGHLIVLFKMGRGSWSHHGLFGPREGKR